MLIDILIASIIIGKLRKGKINGKLNLSYPWLVVIAFIVQVVATTTLDSPGREFVIVASYFMLIVFAMLNFKKNYIRILSIGLILNTLVIAVNGGRMPVSLSAARKIGYDVTPLLQPGSYFKQQVLSATTHLRFLGDIIPLYFPIPRVVSPGDLLIYLGVFLLIQDYMGCPVNLQYKRTTG